MTQSCNNKRSIGLQVNLCHCAFSSNSSYFAQKKENYRSGSGTTNFFIFPQHLLEKSNQEMDSKVNAAEVETECELLLSGENSRKEDRQECGQDGSTLPLDEAEPLLQKCDWNPNTENTSNKQSSTMQQQAPTTKHQPLSASGSSGEIGKKDHSHHYHFKRKFNFRSDSVFSDVLPSSSQEYQKPHDETEKAGSLSSLKPKESKWVTLRKKFKITSTSTTEKQKHEDLPEPKSTHKSGIHDKRSIFKRAMTLGMLPVNKKEPREELPSKRHVRQQQPPELFNVGGEMNLIPLELLIDINDIQISK